MAPRTKPLVFISCGQATEEESALGTEVADLVRDLTGWEPYFAEEQRNLMPITTNLFAQLADCVGYIAILHRRGEVTMPNGARISRASVWVEQEIAIASFLAHEKRNIRLQAYVERGIHLEGVREKIQVNPVEFGSSMEVVQHLKKTLPAWPDFSPMTGRSRDPREQTPNVRAEFVHAGGGFHVNEGTGLGTIEIKGIRAEQDVRINAPSAEVPRSSNLKSGRNDPCHCGSGKKFKRCHGA